jgi:hypothetical protein
LQRCARTAIAVSAALVCAGSGRAQTSGVRGPGPLPPAIRTLLSSELNVPADEIRALESGKTISRALEGDASREVALFGATWVDASPAAYLDAVKNIERLERGAGFIVTRRISDPPRLSDFDALELPQGDIDDLKNCEVGRCELKLAASAVERMRREIDWSHPSHVADANALARRMALDFVTAYQRGGNSELAVYRDGDRPTFVAREFESLIERTPALAHIPEMRAYLIGYPTATLPDATSFLYWHTVKFGLKPTVRINHVVIQERSDLTLIAIKQLYASHYFWTALQLQALVPSARGFYLLNLSRSRSDGLSGFVGRLIRGKVTNEAQKGMVAGLEAAKAALSK